MSNAVQERVPSAGLQRPAGLALLLLLGGCLNGYVAQFANWLMAPDFGAGFTLPVSVLDLFILWIATGCSLSPPGDRLLPIRLPELITSVCMLAPSSAFSWAATSFYGLTSALRFSGAARAGSLLFSGFAAVNLWETVLIKWVSVPAGRVDAALAGNLLRLFRADAFYNGNVLGIADGHSIVLLYGCTGLFILPKLLLFQIAAAIHRDLRWQIVLNCVAVTAVAGTFANLLRLAVMASSARAYEALHSPIGLGLFDFSSIGIAIAVTVFAGARDDAS